MTTRVPTVSEEALRLYTASAPIDLHVESFVWTRVAGYDLTKRHGHGLFGARLYSQVDFPRIREAGLAGATWVISTNPLRGAEGRLRAFDTNLARLSSLFEESRAEFQLVTNHDEYVAARARGAHAAFLGIQGGNALDRDLDALDRLDDGRILRITLVHMSTSRIGVTSSPFRLAASSGLTPFGRDYVRRLDEKRVFVDLAHISPQGFWDAVGVHDASLPLIVTHTGVSGVHAHWRNLDDDQIRAIADTGGTIGIIYHSEYLGDGLLGGRLSTVVDHIAHVVDVVGEDHVSLGSDWDGMICTPRDMPTCLELPRIVQHMLDRGWTDTRIGKILSGNFLRALKHLRG